MSWKAYPEYKDSGIDWLDIIPGHWEKARLGYVAKMIVPMRDKPPVFEGDIPWIRIEDFDGKYIFDSKSEQRVSVNTVTTMNLKIFPVGTVLCSCSCRMGTTAIVGSPLVSNQTFIGIVPNDGLNSDFLYYLMQTMSENLQMTATGAIQQYLAREDFQSIRFFLPPYDEQKSIANFLDRETSRIDALIEKKQRQIELLQEKRTALISHAVTKGLDPNAKMKDSRIEWLGEIPTHWTIRRIKRLVSIVGGGTPSKNIPEYWNGDIPWVSPKDMKEFKLEDSLDHINESALAESATKIVEKDSVLIVVRSGILRKKLPVSINEINVTLNQDMKALVPHGEMISEYLALLIEGSQSQLLTEWKKAGTTVESLELDLIENTLLPVPPVTEQEHIVNYLEKEAIIIGKLVKKISFSIDKLNEYRNALISAAVTGKIDVRGEVA